MYAHEDVSFLDAPPMPDVDALSAQMSARLAAVPKTRWRREERPVTAGMVPVQLQPGDRLRAARRAAQEDVGPSVAQEDGKGASKPLVNSKTLWSQAGTLFTTLVMAFAMPEGWKPLALGIIGMLVAITVYERIRYWREGKI